MGHPYLQSRTNLSGNGQHPFHTGRRPIILRVSIDMFDHLGDKLGIMEWTRPHRSRQLRTTLSPSTHTQTDDTHVHVETTLGARRADGGSSGHFVLEIDRAGLFVRLFYDPPQLLPVEGRTSRADIVDGRFAFVHEC